ncbi:MAG: hypothetical protein M1827_000823 [Pycnora praestabilis]|nr:MAG: hypothetical protein M1827_000823 [Pycnora praestabilis]
MPQWGRPPGAGKEKRRKDGEEARRFEELQSEDDEGHGVRLGVEVQQRRYASDELHFDGIDISPRSPRRRDSDDSDDTESSEDSDERDYGDGRAMQLALKDKEEVLVQKAMERIRRAQLKGKSNVNLTRQELDALERKRQRAQIAAARQGKESRSSSSSSNNKRRKPDRISVPLPIAPPESSRRRSRRSSPGYEGDSPPYTSGAAPPGFLVPGPGGASTYAPLGYYASPTAHPSALPSYPQPRSASSQTQQQRSPPQPQYQHQSQQNRYFSVPEGGQPSQRPENYSSRSSPSSRQLPDDVEWTPPSRSRSSSSAQRYPLDPFQYQTYSPPIPQIPAQYLQDRRSVSGSPDTLYSSGRRAPPSAYTERAKVPASSSDPALNRRRPLAQTASDETSSEDDGNSGVQVEVITSATSPRGARAGGSTRSGGRQRRARR